MRTGNKKQLDCIIRCNNDLS